MHAVFPRFLGAALGLTLAAIGAILASHALHNHFVQPPNPRNPATERSVFILMYGSTIFGASVSGGIAGAMKSWKLAVVVAAIGVVMTGIPIAFIVFVFGTLVGIDRFGADHAGFVLFLLQFFCLVAAPLVVAPIAGLIGQRFCNLASRSS